ncbi:MAG: glycosyltransferase family 4 protein [Ignavibacteria bacterium]
MLKDKKEIRKKVIITGSVPPPVHGSSIYLSNLLNSKVKDEFEIFHHDISDHRDIKNLSKLDITNIKLALKSISGMRKIVKEVKPDIVYIPVASNFLPYLRDGLMIITASAFSNAKIVIHLHEGNYFNEVFYNNSLPPVKWFIRHSLSKVNTAIVFSEKLKENFDGKVKNITAFMNGLDLVPSDPLKKVHKDSDEKFIVSFCSNHYESKGIIDILKSVPAIIKEFPKTEFHFAGAWSDEESSTKQKAENIINKNGIKNNIKFHGVVSGKAKENFFDNTDILLLPTYYPHEGCPLVIIESFAKGIPVISSNETGAIPEMIEDGVTGLLVNNKNPEQIANAVIKLINDKDLRQKISNACIDSFQNRFTSEININNIITTFYKALN